eukprot:161239_1
MCGGNRDHVDNDDVAFVDLDEMEAQTGNQRAPPVLDRVGFGSKVMSAIHSWGVARIAGCLLLVALLLVGVYHVLGTSTDLQSNTDSVAHGPPTTKTNDALVASGPTTKSATTLAIVQPTNEQPADPTTKSATTIVQSTNEQPTGPITKVSTKPAAEQAGNVQESGPLIADVISPTVSSEHSSSESQNDLKTDEATGDDSVEVKSDARVGGVSSESPAVSSEDVPATFQNDLTNAQVVLGDDPAAYKADGRGGERGESPVISMEHASDASVSDSETGSESESGQVLEGANRNVEAPVSSSADEASASQNEQAAPQIVPFVPNDNSPSFGFNGHEAALSLEAINELHDMISETDKDSGNESILDTKSSELLPDVISPTVSSEHSSSESKNDLKTDEVAGDDSVEVKSDGRASRRDKTLAEDPQDVVNVVSELIRDEIVEFSKEFSGSVCIVRIKWDKFRSKTAKRVLVMKYSNGNRSVVDARETFVYLENKDPDAYADVWFRYIYPEGRTVNSKDVTRIDSTVPAIPKSFRFSEDNEEGTVLLFGWSNPKQMKNAKTIILAFSKKDETDPSKAFKSWPATNRSRCVVDSQEILKAIRDRSDVYLAAIACSPDSPNFREKQTKCSLPSDSIVFRESGKWDEDLEDVVNELGWSN